MGKITVDLDFTEDLMFKTLLLGTMEFQIELVLRDFITCFLQVLDLEVRADDKIVQNVIKYVDRKAVLKVLNDTKLDPAEKQTKLQHIVPDIKVQVIRDNTIIYEIVIEMQKQTPHFLESRINRELATTITNTYNNPANFSQTSHAVCIWVLPIRQLQGYRDYPIVEFELATKVHEADGSYKRQLSYKHSKCAAISISHEKLQLDSRYKDNKRFQLWVNFLVNGTLDLDDKVQCEINRLYEILREDRKWYEMVKNKPTPAELLLATGREEGLEEGLEKGREIGLEEGREIGLEEGREEGLEIGVEIGREEGLEIGREEANLNNIISSIKAGVDIKLITTIFNCTEDYVTKIANEHSLKVTGIK